jgi:hypothetical protein
MLLQLGVDLAGAVPQVIVNKRCGVYILALSLAINSSVLDPTPRTTRRWLG